MPTNSSGASGIQRFERGHHAIPAASNRAATAVRRPGELDRPSRRLKLDRANRTCRVAALFSQFPKQRALLPPEYAAIYLQHYRNSREGKSKILGLAQRAERWMHRKVAEDVATGPAKATLELGAGNLNQLPYEPSSHPYDIVEPFRELFESSPLVSRVRNVYTDIAEVPAANRYDRITSVAVLEHVENLPQVVARAGKLLAGGGSFRAGIQSHSIARADCDTNLRTQPSAASRNKSGSGNSAWA